SSASASALGFAHTSVNRRTSNGTIATGGFMPESSREHGATSSVRSRLRANGQTATLIDVHRIAIAGLGALAVGCLSDRTFSGGAIGSSTTGASTSGVAADTSTSTTSTSGGVSSSTSSLPDFGDAPPVPVCDGFVCPSDVGSVGECEVWAQNCPVGQKC